MHNPVPFPWAAWAAIGPPLRGFPCVFHRHWKHGDPPLTSRPINDKRQSGLFYICECCVEPNNIGSQIHAIGTLVLVRAVRKQFVVSTIAVVVVGELNLI